MFSHFKPIELSYKLTRYFLIGQKRLISMTINAQYSQNLDKGVLLQTWQVINMIQAVTLYFHRYSHSHTLTAILTETCSLDFSKTIKFIR